MEFEWDNNKAIINLQKHGISFTEAATVLGDPLSTTFPDPTTQLMRDALLLLVCLLIVE